MVTIGGILKSVWTTKIFDIDQISGDSPQRILIYFGKESFLLQSKSHFHRGQPSFFDNQASKKR